MQPAHHTKHLPILALPFRAHTFTLAQADDGVSNGTALWLPGQVLSALIASLPAPKSARPRALELGSGIGFTALVLASLGWHVTATDAHPAVLSLLSQNVQRNLLDLDLPGSVQVCKLDWCAPPEEWTLPQGTEPFDLVLTADTLYNPNLTPHLLRTLQHFGCPETGPPVPIYIAFERRDPDLIDAALASLPQPTRIPHRKLVKAMQSAGWGDWNADDWTDAEVWKVRWKSSKQRVEIQNVVDQ
ncbi:methyltransferase domain protein [Ceratobasidium sp. AG-Ba]|nr:methyltransferase domain protein [Ceratobasidium sp. AG-Ba]